MIKRYPYKNLGHHNMGWLNAKYHFSFADYRNKERMGFGALRVINDDIISAGAGFDTHPHQDMEIITYVKSGAITHRDSKGNKGRTEAGNIQVISAGTGIYHSEYNLESEDTSLYQIWIHPKEKGIDPQWNNATFPKTTNNQSIPLLVSGYEEDQQSGALHIHQDAKVYGGFIDGGKTIKHPIIHQAYVLISEGTVTIDNTKLNKGDGAEITETHEIKISSHEDSEIIIIDVPQYN